MVIIISPSKTQSPAKSPFLKDKELLYPTKHKKVLAALRKLKKTEISSKMKLSKDLTNSTYNNIKNYNSLEENHAFMSFEGFVFKGLEKDKYQAEEYRYVEEHVRILDAFYGVLEPGTLMKPYRLDFLMNIGLNLYTHWDIERYFRDELVINLASNEFSKMLPTTNMISIHFRENKNGTFVNQATYSKMARGKILNFMIWNKITDIDAIKAFKEDGYTYHKELSDEENIVFTR